MPIPESTPLCTVSLKVLTELLKLLLMAVWLRVVLWLFVLISVVLLLAEGPPRELLLREL